MVQWVVMVDEDKGYEGIDYPNRAPESWVFWVLTVVVLVLLLVLSFRLV